MGVGKIKLVGVGEGEGVGRGEVRGGWDRRSRGWDDEWRERSFYVLILFFTCEINVYMSELCLHCVLT